MHWCLGLDCRYIIVHCEHFIMEGYLTNYSCTDSGTTMHSLLCIFGLLAGNIFQQQFYSVWYTWNVLLKSRCLCCAFRYRTSWPGECCRRCSLYGRQLSKRRPATYTRLKEGNALVCFIIKEWHPLLPKIVNAAPNQNIHWRICKGRQEEKQNIDVLFWWPKYWCSLLATKILMFCFADEYYLNGHL